MTNTLRIIFAAIVITAAAVSRESPAAAPTIQPGSWTLAILPDTQNYAASYPDIFNAQMQFLADNKNTLNLAYVLHEGDVTNNNSAAEWSIASNAFKILDDAGVPYSLLPGNHDLGSNGAANNRTSLMANYFPVSRLAERQTFGGTYTGEPASPHNSYSLFSAGGTDWLALALEFGPRDAVVDWADGILKKYPDRQAMIVTHAYLFYDNTRYDWAARGASQPDNPHAYALTGLPGGVNDGQEMWDKLKDNPNLQFIFSGHVLQGPNGGGNAYLASEADRGNVVHQVLANYQHFTNGGDGFLRLLEFLPDGKTVHVRTYSPTLDLSLASTTQDFSIIMTQVTVPELGGFALLACGGVVLSMVCVWHQRAKKSLQSSAESL